MEPCRVLLFLDPMEVDQRHCQLSVVVVHAAWPQWMELVALHSAPKVSPECWGHEGARHWLWLVVVFLPLPCLLLPEQLLLPLLVWLPLTEVKLACSHHRLYCVGHGSGRG